MNKSIAFGLVAFALMATPSMAAPLCSGSYALDLEIFSETELNDYYLNQLQANGVRATRTEIWGGCVRAFVRLDNGVEEMQFFEPVGLRRVE